MVFEEAARAHAVRLVERGELDPDIVVGRWWSTSGEALEIDVLGLKGGGAEPSVTASGVRTYGVVDVIE